MNIILSVILIYLGFYLLYLVSEKQRPKTLKSAWRCCAKNSKICKYIAYTMFFISIFCLCLNLGSGIGIVSFFIFATPLIFMIILYCNDLKAKDKSKSSRMHKHHP
ncbi:hypothetical protein [Acinetobacter shaoyimingii]|uniref:DUF1634 domain-containing protein n=1 Tax=Acinetobacter shaoyimingii TaxID=2715164 RepID=A0A6G8RV19_9GAMM|nr:hypothetical protein [Acinetobacter shaoyimingii]NHB58624.1 hypothetical protein [Acinetobacter shaoyimingii]QIO05731.1 hypothetical protein G8E00_07075 [Acinetobacter shaoyimingii]